MNLTNLLGFFFLILFLGLILFFAWQIRERQDRYLRASPAFTRLKESLGMAVEAGKRLHISLGHGGLQNLQGGSAFIGLSILKRIARVASVSDYPPISSSGEGTIALLSQDTLQSVYREIGSGDLYQPELGQLTGLTPFSFAAGALPIIYDENVSINLIAGHFGSEVVLLTDAAERNGSLTLAGSDSITAQAILYAAAQESLVGEELYASGAYIQAGPFHSASVRAQDFIRWFIIVAILAGAFLKLVGAI